MATEKVTYELSLRDLMSKGLADINSKMSTMEKKLGDVEKTGQKTGLGLASAFRMIGGAIAAVGLVSFGRDAVMATAKMQSLGNAIKFASDSSLQGELSMTWLSNFSGKWGVDLNAASEGFKTFQGAMIKTKFSSNEVRKMFEQVSMGGIAMGLSAEDTKGTFLALGQIMGKGKVQAEELRGQIGERVPGAFAIAARAMNVTTMELDKLMKDGKLMAEDFLPKFAAEMEKTFGAGAAGNVDNLTSNINRMSNAFLDLQVSIGESQGGIIANSLTIWTNLLSGIADQFKTINQLSKINTNDDTLRFLNMKENTTKSIVSYMQKKGSSKDEIAKALTAGQASAQFSSKFEIQSITDQINAFEKKMGGVGSSWNPFASEEGDRRTLYDTFPEYKALVDKKTQKEQLMQGGQSILDKELSNLYSPQNGGALESEKLAKQSAEVSGSVPKVVNINIEALIKEANNYFGGSGVNVQNDAKSFLDQLQNAFQLVITDTAMITQTR